MGGGGDCLNDAEIAVLDKWYGASRTARASSLRERAA